MDINSNRVENVVCINLCSKSVLLTIYCMILPFQVRYGSILVYKSSGASVV